MLQHATAHHVAQQNFYGFLIYGERRFQHVASRTGVAEPGSLLGGKLRRIEDSDQDRPSAMYARPAPSCGCISLDRDNQYHPFALPHYRLRKSCNGRCSATSHTSHVKDDGAAHRGGFMFVVAHVVTVVLMIFNIRGLIYQCLFS